MNANLYNNTINKSEGSAKAILKNLGVAFPSGTVEEARNVLLSDNYMLWEECSSREAQQAADNGVAAIAVGNEELFVIKANTDEEENTENPAAKTVSKFSTEAIAEMSFFSYTANRKELSTLDRLKIKFPNGKYWNHYGMSGNNPNGYTNTPCPTHSTTDTCNLFDGAWQCMGFAYRCGYEATGISCMSWTKYTSLTAVDNIKPGDVVHYFTASGSPHTVYVTHVGSSSILCGDCNGQGPSKYCVITWGKSVNKSTIRSGFRSIRSAPVTLDT